MATRELQPPTSRPPMAKGEPHTSLASHWPQRGGLRTSPHWPSGRPPLATKGREGDAFARPSPRLATYAPTPHTGR